MQISKMKALPLALVAAGLCQTALAAKYPAIYPFVPTEKEEIYAEVKKVTEDRDFIKNFNEIIHQGLSKAKTKEKPWTSSYWPMNKGMIADPYEESAIPYYLDIGWVAWKNNYDGFKDRLKDELSRVDEMSEEELSELAPSEKYDLLLGDKSFDLTKRLWEYTYKWGSEKENAFITRLILVGEDSLDLANDYIDQGYYTSVDDAFANSWNLKTTLSAKRALELVASGVYRDSASAFPDAVRHAQKESDNYVLEEKNSRMASWEGICNGWATAAGLVPRPRKSVSIQLPDGRNLRFYPSDIKALASLYYVNSLIQDGAIIGDEGLPVTQGVVSAGKRCNLKNARTDLWGRRYDHKDDPFNDSTHPIRDSRCSGVHPAVWHLGLVNLIGKQSRSFVVERKVGAAVDNHPMYGYEFEYFNPENGWAYEDLEDNIEKADKYDQFEQFRHKDARYIVGVKATAIYLDYAKPNRDETNDEDDDSEVDKVMYYDLELDENYNIVGGQWRAFKTGRDPRRSHGRPNNHHRRNPNHNQPDFFWTITKNYKSTGWFDNESEIEPWTDKSQAPPRSWIDKAREYHRFEYKMLVKWGNVATCRVWNLKEERYEKVYCEQSYNKPQPLINVLNGLIELAK